MNGDPVFVLDSSALLAYLWEEPGAPKVREALSRRAAISAANWAEVLSKLADFGADPHLEERRMSEQGLLGKQLTVFSIDQAMAVEIAVLRTMTRSAGLSLGDRACLALARRLRVPALTADRFWQSLKLGVKVRSIR